MKKSFYASTALAVALTSLLLACGGGGGNAGTVANTGGLPNSGGAGAVSSTSPDRSISLTVGSGDKIETTANEIKYRKIFAATVTDTNGTPIQGAKVSVRAEMLGFRKGYWDIAASPAQMIIASTCANEDTNNNNILDPGEDTNGSGELEPRIASVVTGAVGGVDTTDSQGIVYIAVEYAKKDASWLDYQLTVSTTGLSGATEVTTKFKQSTGWVAGDESANTNPFAYSRFGQQAGCNNTH